MLKYPYRKRRESGTKQQKTVMGKSRIAGSYRKRPDDERRRGRLSEYIPESCTERKDSGGTCVSLDADSVPEKGSGHSE